MIVDDVISITKLTSKMFSDEIICVQFQDPYMVLDEFINGGDKFDLVITDYNMPNMTGLEMIREMISAGWEGPNIILTCVDEFKVRDSDHVVDVYQKPIYPYMIEEMEVLLSV